MRRIRTGLWIIAAVLGVGFVWATSFAAQTEETAKLAPDLAALQERITKLEKRVAELESQLAFTRQAPLNLLLQPQPHASPALPRESVPQDWLPREFNGMKYYIVPLAPGQTTR